MDRKITFLSRVWDGAKDLLSDERGAEGLEKLLIIGAIALPLLGILILFRSQITEMVGGAWGNVSDDFEQAPPPELGN